MWCIDFLGLLYVASSCSECGINEVATNQSNTIDFCRQTAIIQALITGFADIGGGGSGNWDGMQGREDWIL